MNPIRRVNSVTLRRLFFFIGDVCLLIVSLAVALTLRFDGMVPPAIWLQFPLVAVVSLAAKLPVFARQRLYAVSWSQVGLDDMIAVARGVTIGSALFGLAVFALKVTQNLPGFPRSAVLLDYVLSLMAIGGLRVGRRVFLHLRARRPAAGVPALIVGAGSTGEQLARSLRVPNASGYSPIAFVDDDPRKLHTMIQGLRVLGVRGEIPTIVHARGIGAVLIAMPTASSKVIRNIVSLSRDAGIRDIRIVPGLDRMLTERLSFSDLREVQLTDLLGREVIQVETASVEAWLEGRTVLVTGAGGSIGSELCRQIAQFRPKLITLVDWDETGVFWVEHELRRLEQRVVTRLTDVRDAAKMEEIFQRVNPQVVFHAAAYKHVGLMERHPEEALTTNIFGALTVARASLGAGVEKFVFISTDKAVNPTSIMGVTKRVAEEVCMALNRHRTTRFIAVRFGNVLGSRGSVVPLFQENIRRGEAITIRGPNMRRYFMATSEAVLLVVQAGAMGQGGEVFVLDMGEPVRIIDLAKEMIRQSGLDPDTDVPIVFTEPEPGEKELEDLLTAEEGTVATRHDRIFMARASQSMTPETLLARVESLREPMQIHDLPSMIETLQELVPTYRVSELLTQRLRVSKGN
ncbi:MAG TPA: nucleoside-diphosphate sugar epimerase/dehydratase [bacterium]|nr:nucleoside-diphosphate sugar epimerase/dehydratase [bacterium]